MSAWTIREAQPSDRDALAGLRALLWPDATVQQHAADLDRVFVNGTNGTMPVAIFVSENRGGDLIGFLEIGLRSHADGCDTARPVGFVEGWFVQPSFQNRGVGRELMCAAEDWSRTHGCLEIASDALIDNEPSLRRTRRWALRLSTAAFISANLCSPARTIKDERA